MIAVEVSHNFETAHRLPVIGGKCQNLHGHSWTVAWTIAGEPDANGLVVEYGDLKRVLRGWVDAHLDHGTMLGAADPLVGPLLEEGCRVFRFGVTADPDLSGAHRWSHGRAPLPDAEDLVTDLDWPAVESVAQLLARVGTLFLEEVAPGRPDVRVVQVDVRETAVNRAQWVP